MEDTILQSNAPETHMPGMGAVEKESRPPFEPLWLSAVRSAITALVATVVIVSVLTVSGYLIVKSLQPSPEEQAIGLAKGYSGGAWQILLEKLTGVKTPDTVAASRLPQDGTVKEVKGWYAEPRGDRHLVSFTWVPKGGQAEWVQGYWFEVDVKQGIVVPVIGNPELEKKYGLEKTNG